MSGLNRVGYNFGKAPKFVNIFNCIKKKHYIVIIKKHILYLYIMSLLYVVSILKHLQFHKHSYKTILFYVVKKENFIFQYYAFLLQNNVYLFRLMVVFTIYVKMGKYRYVVNP